MLAGRLLDRVNTSLVSMLMLVSIGWQNEAASADAVVE